jgi:hypothetical protein
LFLNSSLETITCRTAAGTSIPGEAIRLCSTRLRRINFIYLKLIRAFQFRLPWFIPPRQEAQVKGGEKKSILSAITFPLLSKYKKQIQQKQIVEIFFICQS